MRTLPADYTALVRALTSELRDASAGMITAEADDDPDLIWAALEEAERRAGRSIRRAWIGHDHAILAWLHEDDIRLRMSPELEVVGIAL